MCQWAGESWMFYRISTKVLLSLMITCFTMWWALNDMDLLKQSRSWTGLGLDNMPKIFIIFLLTSVLLFHFKNKYILFWILYLDKVFKTLQLFLLNWITVSETSSFLCQSSTQSLYSSDSWTKNKFLPFHYDLDTENVHCFLLRFRNLTFLPKKSVKLMIIKSHDEYWDWPKVRMQFQYISIFRIS